MNRREFGKTALLTTGAMIIIPKIMAEPTSPVDPLSGDLDWNKATPEQQAAIERMYDNMPPSAIFKKIAKDIPQEVPDGAFIPGWKSGWKYGSFRIIGSIGGYHPHNFQDGYVYDWGKKCKIALHDVDLSDIKYVALWRQTACNKYRQNEPVRAFASVVPFDWVGEVVPGQEIHINKYIAIGTRHDEIERMAQESFVKLQDVVKEYAEEKV